MGSYSRVRALLAGILALGAALHGAFAAPATPETPVIVFAAASLKNVLDAIESVWEKQSGQSVRIAYAASSTLAKQLEAEAPAQIFISADTDWMDYVAAKGLIKEDSRRDLVGNRLVLVAPKASTSAIDLKQGADLGKALDGGRLAVGATGSVPAGKYAKAALEKLGMWSSVSGKLAESESVRAALLLVSRGEAPLGIVYASDAVSDPNVKVVGTFPEDSHPPIIYPAALTKNAGPAAAAFLGFVLSAKAASVFEANGFTMLGKQGP
jgi:molybdate transport system substrate-binding protein